MEPSDLPPLPPIKKRKHKQNKRPTMNRSRSFVAEMFHVKTPTNKSTKKWSNNDMQLLQKLGISPNQNRNEKNLNDKLKISPNLHPELKIAALEEQINSLNIELHDTKNNLMRAAEYGQHLIEENQKLDSVVLELRNEAAEYIAQLCELREENDTFKLEVQSNEYSVSEYEHRMYQFKNDKDELKNKLQSLNEQINEYKSKYDIQLNKSKLYQNEIEKYQIEKNKLTKQSNKHIDELKTKILVLQNTNHSVLMENDQITKKYQKIKQEMHILESEYNEIYNQYKGHDGGSISGDSPHRITHISRRRSHSRSRSDKREESEEKMDEIIGTGDNEYKSDPINIKNIEKYNQVLIECMDLFENIMDDQHIYSPIKLKQPSNYKMNSLNENEDIIDIELFKDLMDNVRNKLRTQKYGGGIRKRNISELRRHSKSHSNFMETLDNCIVSTDEENSINKEMKETEIEIGIVEEDEEEIKDDIVIEYEADNEDLDNELPNKEMIIEPIDDKKKKCVEQFLVRYSEDYSWKEISSGKGKDEYELEIEFNESVNLVNKRNNSISISGKLLQSLTNLIENIMGIPDIDDYKSPYFSMCGWFCGKSNEDATDYSQHYLNILSTLDYNKENREETYWVIYQLLNIVYKFHNHTKSETMYGKSKDTKGMRSDNILCDYKDKIGENNDGNISDSESMSMILTDKKSKYAELRPPRRKKGSLRDKIKLRGSFHPLNNISSDDEDIQ